VQVATHDEVGEVAECFNRMVSDIRELINRNDICEIREKESELSALQAQINPHFLYNTLDSLYWQAMNSGNEDLAETIFALSQLFRLVLNQGRKEVAAAQEVELVTRCLQIEKFRFGERLCYDIEVEEDVKKAVIPELILQPFAEYAVVHGLENVEHPCKITVTGSREQENVLFVIADNGAGMTKEQVQALFEKETEKKYAKQRGVRFAIRNIRERLQLRYGDRFSLEIESQKGEGTRVMLRVPFETGEEKEEASDCGWRGQYPAGNRKVHRPAHGSL
jgi:two-component system sensor histidine kinase YesM